MTYLHSIVRILVVMAVASFVGLGTASAQQLQSYLPGCDPSGDTPKKCDPGDINSISQDIDVKIPTVVRLVLDQDVTSDSLSNWNLNFTGKKPGKHVENCYVIPNWVGDITHGISFETFLGVAGDDGLVEWKPEYGYPAIITKDGSDAVATWGYVTGNSAYHTSGNDVPAKGNVVCKYEFMVEKYTNLPDGASFDVELTTDSDGFGALYIEDVVKANGIDYVFGTGDASFTSAGSDHLVDIDPNHFFDDYVTQWLDLTTSQPGHHDMTLTYTLSATVAD